jgi:hypothetical protein
MAGHSYFDDMLERNLVLQKELNATRMQIGSLRAIVESLAHYRVPEHGKCSWCHVLWNSRDEHDWSCPVTDARSALRQAVGGKANAAN